MTWKRAVTAACIAIGLLAAPAAALGGIAVWQEYAPASLRQVILTAAALTEPKRVDRVLESLGVAADKAASPG